VNRESIGDRDIQIFKNYLEDSMNGVLVGLAMLIIGDSHIAGFGRFNNALHEGLTAQGAAVDTFGVCGSIPSDWITPQQIICGRGERHNGELAKVTMDEKLRGWALPALIAQYKPNVVVVELGENLAEYGVTPTLPRDWISQEVSLLLQPIRSSKLPCIWVGPTWGTENGPTKKTFERVKQLSDYLSQIVTPCRYINSLAFSQPGEWATLDGVHLTANSTRLWDSDLIGSIDQIAAMLPRH
jgi:lysophospholipase L1-like esterase